MPKKPAEPEVQENNAPKIDPQKQYLMDQFGNLMEQVGDGFGGPLQEELISRLEQTIADFHEEVNEMLDRLKDNSEKRHEKLKEIWNNPDVVIDETSQADNGQKDGPGLNTEEMSEWEKKIESASKENPVEEKPKEKEVKKKKGFFGRKKK